MRVGACRGRSTDVAPFSGGGGGTILIGDEVDRGGIEIRCK